MLTRFVLPTITGCAGNEKIHHLILLVIGLATLLGSGGWLWYSRFAEKPLSCIGNVEWNIGSNRFAGTLAFRMYDNAGLATITGKLYGRNTSDISRNIYFNYTRQHEARVLQAMQVVKTFADSADETDINNTLPGFTAKADEPSVWSWKSIRAHGSLPAQCTLAVLPQEVTSYPETKIAPLNGIHICHHRLTRHGSLNPLITHCYSSSRIRKHPEYHDIHCVIIKRNGRFILSRRLQSTDGYLEKAWAGAFISLASNV